MAKKWMAKAFKNAHGQLTAEAKKHGMSAMTYARKNYHAKGLLGERSRAAVNANK